MEFHELLAHVVIIGEQQGEQKWSWDMMRWVNK